MKTRLTVSLNIVYEANFPVMCYYSPHSVWNTVYVNPLCVFIHHDLRISDCPLLIYQSGELLESYFAVFTLHLLVMYTLVSSSVNQSLLHSVAHVDLTVPRSRTSRYGQRSFVV